MNDRRATIFAACGAAMLLLAAVQPAWRLQIFSSLDAYYLARSATITAAALFFWLFSGGFSRNLALGATAPVKTGFGDPLLSLRALACMIVMIGHGTTITFAPGNLVQVASDSRTFWLLFPMPWAGVWIFFTLSGYLMGKGFFTGRYDFSRDGMIRFYRNRLLRIVPLYYLAIFTVAIIEHPEALRLAGLKDLASLLLFDFEGMRPPHLIGLLWSIATEMQFYLLAPFLAALIYAIARRIGVLPVGLFAVAFGLCYRLGTYYFFGDGPSVWIIAVYSPLLGNLDIFLLGMLSSFIVQRYPLHWARVSHGVWLAVAMYVVAALCWSRLFVDPSVGVSLRYLAPTGFALTTATIIVLLENGARYRLTSAPIRALIARTQILGTLTYAIYLWHEPVFLLYAKLLPSPVMSRDTLEALGIAGLLVFALSWLSWYLVERPIDAIRRPQRSQAGFSGAAG